MPNFIYAQLRRLRRGMLISLIALAAWPAVVPNDSAAQDPAPQPFGTRRRVVPSDEYFFHFRQFYEGEYVDSLRDFRSDGRGAVKTATSRWIDSISYHTMTGESYYHMGQLAEALEHYTSALELVAAFPDWMLRLRLPDVIPPATPGAIRHPPWGRSQRQARLGRFNETYSIAQGRINNEEQVRRGGVVQPAMFFPVRVSEIVRCTTIAQRRRRQLMGPLSEHDRLSKDVSAVLSRAQRQFANHWVSSWIDVQVGLAFAAENRPAQAKERLTRSVLAAGQYNHPFTATALLELGKIALAEGDLDSAREQFEEATYAAYQFIDPGLIEEAFRYAALAHLLSNRREVYAPLEVAARWAGVKNYRQLQASLLESAAENYAALGRYEEAESRLNEARQVVGRRDMRAGWIGARLNYLTAQLRYRQGDFEAGDAALAEALDYQRGGSHRLFHVSLTDGFYESARITPRIAMRLYDILLNDPGPENWLFDPFDSLAFLLTPQERSIENWFKVALARRERGRAVEIADLARRREFQSTLPLGGRLLALRWILEAPAQAISRQAALQRQDLMTRYTGFAELSRHAKGIIAALRAEPLGDEEPEELRARLEQLAALEQTSGAMEQILLGIAVGREPSEIVFPPRRPTEVIQQALGDSTAALVFFETTKDVHVFLLAGDRLETWSLGRPAQVRKRVATLLKSLGQLDANRELSRSHLVDDEWQREAVKFTELIWEKAPSNTPTNYDELVVVPDGALWYVPFELLGARSNEQYEPLISHSRVRVLPTASLIVPQRRGRIPDAVTAVVLGRLAPGSGDEEAAATFDQLSDALPGAVALTANFPASAATLSSVLDRVIVLDDIVDESEGPLGWAPLRFDQGKPGSRLYDLMRLPAVGPDQWILPGFHSAAENSMRGVPADAAGRELFLSVCGLMASGARTILISRWRTGGATNLETIREFAQELPHAEPADAWQRSVFLTMDLPVDPAGEPRVERDRKELPFKASHPFFWGGYLLVDSGAANDDAPDPADALEAAIPGNR